MVNVPLRSATQIAEGCLLEKVEVARLAAGVPPFSMSRFWVDPGARTPVDQHKDSEVWMVACGRGMVTYRGKETIEVKSGDILEFEPNASHTLINTGGEPILLFSVWWG
jgi:mannose-6-phosphate isomerase-like protein (cupin superfamily)